MNDERTVNAASRRGSLATGNRFTRRRFPVMLVIGLSFPLSVAAQLTSALVNAKPNGPGFPMGYAYLETGWGSPNADNTTPILFRNDFNMSPISITVGAAYLIAHNDTVTNGWTVGGGLGLDLNPIPAAGNRVWGFRLYSGVTYASHDHPAGTLRQWDIPVALGIGWDLPIGPVSVLPWVAAELRLRSTDVPVGGERFDEGVGGQFGISVTKQQPGGAGLLNTLTNVGVQLSGGFLHIQDIRPGHGDFEFFLRLGAHLTYRL